MTNKEPHGANSLGKRADPFVKRVEEIEREIDSLKSQHMLACKEKREDRKEVYKEVKSAGLPVRPVKGIVKKRRLDREIAAIPADFDLDEAAQYHAIADTLGPLGQAAAERAGYAANTDQQKQEERLATVGRGPVVPLHPVDGLAT